MEARASRPNAVPAGKTSLVETVEVVTPISGKISVVIEGHRSKGETVVLTVHDVGSNSGEMRDFLAQPVMSGIARRCVWVHVNVPGQEENAADRDPAAEGSDSSRPAFPSMQQFAEELPLVLNQLNITSVVAFGYGAGANILLRFALSAKERVLGVVLLNCTASSAGFLESQREKAVGRRLSRAKSVSHSSEEHLAYLHFGAKLADGGESFAAVWQRYCDYLGSSINPKNLHHYLMSYFERNNLLPHLGTLSCPLLLIAGARSMYAHTVHSLNAAIQRTFKNEPEKRRQMEYLRVDGVVSPMHEKPEKLAECIQYFLQGLGLLGSLSPIMPSAGSFANKESIIEFRSSISKQGADNSDLATVPIRTLDDSAQPPRQPLPGARGRRMSMQEFDVPRGPDSFRAYGAQAIRGVRAPSLSD